MNKKSGILRSHRTILPIVTIYLGLIKIQNALNVANRNSKQKIHKISKKNHWKWHIFCTGHPMYFLSDSYRQKLRTTAIKVFLIFIHLSKDKLRNTYRPKRASFAWVFRTCLLPFPIDFPRLFSLHCTVNRVIEWKF